MWESSHVLSFTAALAIHTYPLILASHGSMHTHSLYFALYQLILAAAIFVFHDKLYLNMCIRLGGIYAMNKVIVTKRRIALTVNIRVLENPWRIVQVLRWVQNPTICADLDDTWYLHSIYWDIIPRQVLVSPQMSSGFRVRAIQKLDFRAIFGLPIATKSTITLNVIIVFTYQLHHVVAHKFLFYLICLMSISHNFEVKDHC